MFHTILSTLFYIGMIVLAVYIGIHTSVLSGVLIAVLTVIFGALHAALFVLNEVGKIAEGFVKTFWL